MTDREMLELAAKAAGICPERDGNPDEWHAWDPLEDDGDALRLAGVLGLVVDCSRPSAGLPFTVNHPCVQCCTDRQAAIRLAIVRAAADIGKDMT